MLAEEATGNETSAQPLDPFQVIGSEKQVFDMPGSGSYIEEESLERFKFKNINEILLQVPGIYVRDEDGFGNFPNISIRGVDSNRSAKVTLMEDGILTAPAPYSAPSAYYSPTVGRMHAVEVLKGSSQIQYGPHTTGGVINYVSTPIPETTTGFAELSYGNEDTFNGHFWYGGKKRTEAGTVGALFEVHHERSDGFRKIQPSVNGDFEGSGETGFDKTDFMAKFSFEPNWNQRNVFELKLGYTDFDADETYLGLELTDLRDNPWDRYAASALDNIKTEHYRASLRHFLEIDPDSTLTTTVYLNNFKRDWFKLDRVGEANAGATVTPARFVVTNRDILTGEVRGDFKVKSNDREYYLYGIQSKYDRRFETGGWEHSLTVGARIHADEIDRFQDSVLFENVFAGDFDTPTGILGPDTEGDRDQETVAIALHAQDRITHGNWTFTPGLRWEYIDWDFIRRDGGNRPVNPDQGEGSYSIFAPGIGFETLLGGNSKIFGGYHRGFSVPSPGSRFKGFDEETSDTFELGYRNQSGKGVYAEVVGFYTLLDDLIVEDNISGGPGASDGNVGDVETLGIEVMLGSDLGRVLEQPYGIPVRLALTYTQAELDGDVKSEDAESIFAAGEDGNQVPNVPEWQLNFTSGMEFARFRTYATLTYVGKRYADARNSTLQEDTNGNPDARFGKLDSYTLVSLSAFYDLADDIELFARVSNLFEEKYIASTLPLGPRAGAPRLFSAGFNFQF